MKFYLFKHNVLGHLIGNIVRLSPMPRNLPDLNTISTEVLDWLDANIKSDLPEDMFEIEKNDLFSFLYRICTEVRSVEDLNLSQVERERGISVHDESRPTWVATSRYHQLKPEHGFIDLMALANCVRREIELDYGTDDREGPVEIMTGAFVETPSPVDPTDEV